MFSLNGVRIFISHKITTYRYVNRTWKERLFTRPFKPFKKTKAVKELIDTLEDNQVIKTDKGIYMNEFTWNRYQRGLENGS